MPRFWYVAIARSNGEPVGASDRFYVDAADREDAETQAHLHWARSARLIHFTAADLDPTACTVRLTPLDPSAQGVAATS